MQGMTASATEEAATMIKLQDVEYIPKCYGLSKGKDGRSILVMELLKKYKDIECLARKRRLTARQQILIALQTADALSQCHAKDILHNDIKTDNIMVNMSDPNKPKVKVIDFGLASDPKRIRYIIG